MNITNSILRIILQIFVSLSSFNFQTTFSRPRFIHFNISINFIAPPPPNNPMNAAPQTVTPTPSSQPLNYQRFSTPPRPPPYNITQPPNDDNYSSSLKPTIAVIVGILTGLFSITFLLLLYAKHCRHGNDANFRGGTDPAGMDRANSGVDREVIESLPIFRFDSMKGEEEEEGGARECSVCLSRFEPFEMIRLLPKCRHVFHVECLNSWLSAHSTCPLCRYQVEVALDKVTEVQNFDEALGFAASNFDGGDEQSPAVQEYGGAIRSEPTEASRTKTTLFVKSSTVESPLWRSRSSYCHANIGVGLMSSSSTMVHVGVPFGRLYDMSNSRVRSKSDSAILLDVKS